MRRGALKARDFTGTGDAGIPKAGRVHGTPAPDRMVEGWTLIGTTGSVLSMVEFTAFA